MFWERFYSRCLEKNTKPNPLGKKIGISSGVLTKWKTGITIPSGEILAKIADELDCSVDYLLGRTENPAIQIKASEANNQLIELLSQLSPAEQEMISLQIKGLLSAKKSPLSKDSGQE